MGVGAHNDYRLVVDCRALRVRRNVAVVRWTWRTKRTVRRTSCGKRGGSNRLAPIFTTRTASSATRNIAIQSKPWPRARLGCWRGIKILGGNGRALASAWAITCSRLSRSSGDNCAICISLTAAESMCCCFFVRL